MVFDAVALAFSEWRSYTNPDTGKTGWISEGGAVRYDDPRGEDKGGEKSPNDEVELHHEQTGEVFWRGPRHEAEGMLRAAVAEGESIEGLAIRKAEKSKEEAEAEETAKREADDKAREERLKRSEELAELKTPDGIKPGHPEYVAPPPVLYHATYSADAIKREGFKSSDELGKQVLGGSSGHLMSFTTKENAESYRDSLAVARQAARGDLDTADMIALAPRFGVSHERAAVLLAETGNKSYQFFQRLSMEGRKFPMFMGSNWPDGVRNADPPELVAVPSGGLKDIYYNPGETEWRVGDKGLKPIGNEPVKMATSTGGITRFAPAPTVGKPAAGTTALAGRDGAALASLIDAAQARGIDLIAGMVRKAVRTYDGTGLLLPPADVRELAEALAAVNSTANLLGRARSREMHERVSAFGQAVTTFAATGGDPVLSTFATPTGVGIMATPDEAVAYFLSLAPSLDIDPERYADEQRRRAFTLAASANQVLTESVQSAIGKSIKENESTADATARIADMLDASGATHRNPQYCEMVFRTNVADSFVTGQWEEAQSPDLEATFPVWQYLGIDDHRSGADHRPKFNRFYPRSATFADVRGNRPFNCRCALRWVDAYEWDDLQKAGSRVESRW